MAFLGRGFCMALIGFVHDTLLATVLIHLIRYKGI